MRSVPARSTPPSLEDRLRGQGDHDKARAAFIARQPKKNKVEKSAASYWGSVTNTFQDSRPDA